MQRYDCRDSRVPNRGAVRAVLAGPPPPTGCKSGAHAAMFPGATAQRARTVRARRMYAPPPCFVADVVACAYAFIVPCLQPPVLRRPARPRRMRTCHPLWGGGSL
uniref:Uncharacterized protein n=1 Tax=Eutreptiella gymnastica TaxID=73025 RepID=A0A7S4D271_9EUGL